MSNEHDNSMPDPNTPLDPTGGAMPDPNTPLDPAGGAMPDPNMALDPTGGAMPDPNMALDPTGGAMPDPNMALDPTGGSPAEADAPDESWGTKPLDLASEQAELLQFMVPDLHNLPGEIEESLNDIADITGRADTAQALERMADEMGKLTEFFSFNSLTRLADILRRISTKLPNLDDAALPDLTLRIRGIASLIDQFCVTLGVGMEISWPLSTFERRVDILLTGRMLHPELVAWHRGEVERVLELDGVTMGAEDPPTVKEEAVDRRLSGLNTANASSPGTNRQAAAESTIRFTQSRVEDLLNIVRQLVLNKNQIVSLAGDVTRATGSTEA